MKKIVLAGMIAAMSMTTVANAGQVLPTATEHSKKVTLKRIKAAKDACISGAVLFFVGTTACYYKTVDLAEDKEVNKTIRKKKLQYIYDMGGVNMGVSWVPGVHVGMSAKILVELDKLTKEVKESLK